ncbi:hypothetical protein EDC04DRAFT_176351 [Pisolithus marmoratus]|nr:hypothetical protein EDC04DRAFT_176351 [Pisolithus marmoratus]
MSESAACKRGLGSTKLGRPFAVPNISATLHRSWDVGWSDECTQGCPRSLQTFFRSFPSFPASTLRFPFLAHTLWQNICRHREPFGITRCMDRRSECQMVSELWRGMTMGYLRCARLYGPWHGRRAPVIERFRFPSELSCPFPIGALACIVGRWISAWVDFVPMLAYHRLPPQVLCNKLCHAGNKGQCRMNMPLCTCSESI